MHSHLIFYILLTSIFILVFFWFICFFLKHIQSHRHNDYSCQGPQGFEFVCLVAIFTLTHPFCFEFGLNFCSDASTYTDSMISNFDIFSCCFPIAFCWFQSLRWHIYSLWLNDFRILNTDWITFFTFTFTHAFADNDDFEALNMTLAFFELIFLGIDSH